MPSRTRDAAVVTVPARRKVLNRFRTPWVGPVPTCRRSASLDAASRRASPHHENEGVQSSVSRSIERMHSSVSSTALILRALKSRANDSLSCRAPAEPSVAAARASPAPAFEYPGFFPFFFFPPPPLFSSFPPFPPPPPSPPARESPPRGVSMAAFARLRSSSLILIPIFHRDGYTISDARRRHELGWRFIRAFTPHGPVSSHSAADDREAWYDRSPPTHVVVNQESPGEAYHELSEHG